MQDMYFITNRMMEGDGAEIKFKETNECSPNLHFGKVNNKAERTITLVDSPEMFADLRDSEGYTEFLLYVHGFNNQPWTDIFPNADRMQNQLNEADLNHIIVLPIIWPCDDDFGVIKDYWDDQEAADFSGKFLARVIGKLMEWQQNNKDNPCMKRIHMMAHSMGARVFMKSLSYFSKHIARGGVPYLFKNSFLMAPDIPNESLEKNEEGHHICTASQKVVCYYANDDMAMPASKIANVKNLVFSRRLGHSGPEDWSSIPENKVLAANCDSFNNKFDTKGHTYFMTKNEKKSPAFEHMIKMLKGGRIRDREKRIDL